MTGASADLARLLHEASAAPAFAALVDPDDPSFLPPGGLPTRIADFCTATNQTPPRGWAETVRCVLESLALAYRRNVRMAQELSGRSLDVVHVVGGGARNELLCQLTKLTADACRLPVLAGPVEASALGNVLVQARTLGAGLDDLAAMRALVRTAHPVARYKPSGDPAAWEAAESRVYGSSP